MKVALCFVLSSGCTEWTHTARFRNNLRGDVDTREGPGKCDPQINDQIGWSMIDCKNHKHLTTLGFVGAGLALVALVLLALVGVSV